MRRFLVRSLLEHTRDADDVEFEKEFSATDREAAIALAEDNAKMMVDDLKVEFGDDEEFKVSIVSCEEI